MYSFHDVKYWYLLNYKDGIMYNICKCMISKVYSSTLHCKTLDMQKVNFWPKKWYVEGFSMKLSVMRP